MNHIERMFVMKRPKTLFIFPFPSIFPYLSFLILFHNKHQAWDIGIFIAHSKYTKGLSSLPNPDHYDDLQYGPNGASSRSRAYYRTT